MKGRWLALGAAVLAAAVLAAGFGVAADLLVNRPSGATLELKGGSSRELKQLGVKLTAASPPLYCALSDQAADHGLAQGGLAGCPISRQLAEKKAQACGGTTVVQAALARATWSNNPSIGRDHLVWAVVVKGGLPVIWSLPPGGRRLPPVSCQATGTGGPPLPIVGTRTAPVSTVPISYAGPASRVLLLDATSGALLYGTAGSVTGPAGPASAKAVAAQVRG